MEKVEHKNGPDIFGGNCPKCFEDDAVFSENLYLFRRDRSNWVVCEKHRLKWCIGAGLLSMYHEMTKEDILGHEAQLSEYDEVKPVWSDYDNNPKETDREVEPF